MKEGIMMNFRGSRKRIPAAVLFAVLFGIAGNISFAEERMTSCPIIINEVMTANSSIAVNNGREFCDWVELKNISDKSVQMSDFYLTDSTESTPSNPGKKLFRCPDKELGAGEMMVVFCSDEVEDEFHTGFGLDSDKDSLYLYYRDDLADRADLSGIPAGRSYGRIGGEEPDGYYYFETPTPLAENGDGYSFVSGCPEASVPEGLFSPGTELNVELYGKGTVYYTLDGTVPDENSMVYSASIPITETTILRAICKEEGGLRSETKTFSYIIDKSTLPVISIVIDDFKAFRNNYNNISDKNLSLKDNEFTAQMSFFEDCGSFSVPCGLKMRGYTSLRQPKKSMAVYFRGRYGMDSLRYDVFGNGIDKYSSLCIRAGQDYSFAYIRNELMQDLCMEMTENVPTQSSRYSLLFINGEYWGLYCLKEDFSSQYFASHYGISKKSVEREKAPFGRDSSFVKEVYKYALNNRVSSEEGYAYIRSVIDIDNLIDWIILEGVSGNTDTVHNIQVFRSEELDEKWRIVFYDLDWAFTYENFDFENILRAQGNASYEMMVLSTGLLMNEDFRNRFLTRFAELNQTTLSNEHILEEIDRLAGIIEPEVLRDIRRWSDHSETHWPVMLQRLKDLITDYNWAEHNKRELCILVDGAGEFFENYEYDAGR